jgi:hypothetical protein
MSSGSLPDYNADNDFLWSVDCGAHDKAPDPILDRGLPQCCCQAGVSSDSLAERVGERVPELARPKYPITTTLSRIWNNPSMLDEVLVGVQPPRQINRSP